MKTHKRYIRQIDFKHTVSQWQSENLGRVRYPDTVPKNTEVCRASQWLSAICIFTSLQRFMTS